MFLFDGYGKKFDSNDIDWVNRVMSLKSKSASNPWPVIEEILNFWSTKRPQQYKSFLINMADIKETRKDKKYGLSKEGNFRYILDIPEEVLYIIRKVYTADELPMDREFYRAWSKNFPKMMIAEKV